MIQINEMIIRVPNFSKEEARQLAGQIARQIAGNFSSKEDTRYIERIDVKLTIPGNASQREQAAMITDAILAKIHSHSPPDRPRGVANDLQVDSASQTKHTPDTRK